MWHMFFCAALAWLIIRLGYVEPVSMNLGERRQAGGAGCAVRRRRDADGKRAHACLAVCLGRARRAQYGQLLARWSASPRPAPPPADTYLRTIVPIGGLYAGTLWLGNAAYLYLSVSFIQMLKVGWPPGLAYCMAPCTAAPGLGVAFR